SLAVEAVVFVADQYDDRPLRLRRLLEGDADARRVGIALDEVVIEAERVDETLGIGRGGVGGDAVPSPAAIADHQYHRHVQSEQPATDRVARLHHPGI